MQQFAATSHNASPTDATRRPCLHQHFCHQCNVAIKIAAAAKQINANIKLLTDNNQSQIELQTKDDNIAAVKHQALKDSR